MVREGASSIIGAIVALYRMVAARRLSVPTTGQDYLDHIQMRSGVFDVHGFSDRFYSPPGKISAMHFKHTSVTGGWGNQETPPTTNKRRIKIAARKMKDRRRFVRIARKNSAKPTRACDVAATVTASGS